MFWVDSRSRHDYQLFGDTLTFDTTYKMNKYNLVLGLFCGVNHYKNMVIFTVFTVFTVGFVFWENVLSFEWLFDEFLKFMDSPSLKIITDQDVIVKLSIDSKMPSIFHKLCKWHITNKIGDKVGRVYQDHDAMNKFQDILNNSENLASFEVAWQSWVEENNLFENVWLKETYIIRA